MPPYVALDHPYRAIVRVYVDERHVLHEYLATQVDGSPVAQAQLWAPRDFPDTKGVPTTPGTIAPNRVAGH